MRRRWPILAGTVPLALGWTLLAAHPAGAAARAGSPAGGVQPGGPLTAATAPESPAPSRPGTTASPVAAGISPQISDRADIPAGNQTVVQSSNWSGYAATSSGTPFTGVTATWTEPTATCTGGRQYAAFWAGLDGYRSTSVEQTGTEIDCSGAAASYSAWYEFYPDYAVTLPTSSYPVKPGDSFTASVSYAGSTFTATLQDTSAGWSVSQTKAVAGAARSSAEVVAEAPCCTTGGGILRLTNFGTVNFTGATVSTAASSNQDLASLSPAEITMPDTTMSSLNSADGSFSVSYDGTSTAGGGGGSYGSGGSGRGGHGREPAGG